MLISRNILLASPEGATLLKECTAINRAAYDCIWPTHYAQQRGPTMCGPASVAMAMRALTPAVNTQEEDVLGWQNAVPRTKILKCGATLPEIESLVRSLDLRGTRVHADPAPSDGSLESGLLRALRRAPSALVLVNYHMTIAGQPPFGGHFSPLGAFHAPTRRFLVLDCWPDTAPCWIDSDALITAMRAVDSESGLSRGWLEIDAGSETGSISKFISISE